MAFLSAFAILIQDADKIASFFLVGGAPPSELLVPLIAGFSAGIQKGYVWNDPATPTNDPQFPEVPT